MNMKMTTTKQEDENTNLRYLTEPKTYKMNKNLKYRYQLKDKLATAHCNRMPYPQFKKLKIRQLYLSKMKKKTYDEHRIVKYEQRKTQTSDCNAFPKIKA